MRLLASLLVLSAAAFGQADAALAKYVDSIRAIDNHAHVVAPDMAHDKGYDALRCEMLPGTALPWANFRFGPQTVAAWKALYGVAPTSEKDAEARLPQVQAVARRVHGAAYFDWVLDQAGIETVLANRTAMAAELKPPRFRWVPYDDALLFPLDNSQLKQVNPDRRALFEMEEELLQTYFAASGVQTVPATLQEYVDKVVRPTLQRQKDGGAVAIKFEAAYLRGLNFASPQQGEPAAAAYSRFAGSGVPEAAGYKLIQDHLFRTIAIEAGKLGLPVQIHTGTGCGEFFNDPGSDPMLLSSTLNDPALRATKFVLLHGASPFSRNITALIVKPNVYVDLSVLEFMFSPPELANILRPWLEIMPEHVMFGTDSGPFGPGMGWEETAWLGSHTARRAVTLVLSRMVSDGVINAARAREIADGIFRENAVQLYGFKK